MPITASPAFLLRAEGAPLNPAEPALLVEIAFSSDPFDETQVWEDVTADVVSIHTEGGINYETGQAEACIAIVRLYNPLAYYWPDALGSPYHGHVLPVKQIRIQTLYDSVTYPRFRGFIEAWNPVYMGDPDLGWALDLECVDFTKSLTRFKINNVTYALEQTDVRVTNVLDDIGWPASMRDIEVGTYDVQEAIILDGDNVDATAHLQKVAEAENGLIFMGPDGKVNFQRRMHRLLDEAIVCTFGDDPGEGDLPFHDIRLSWDDQYIYNQVRVTNLGGVEQVRDDATSQGHYGIRVLEIADCILADDLDADQLAYDKVFWYANPAWRIKELLILPADHPTDLFPICFGLDISNSIGLRITTGSVYEQFFIDAITEDWRKDGTWEFRFQASTYGQAFPE